MGYETELTELVGPSGKTLRVYEDVDGNVQMELNGTYTTVGDPVVTANINHLTGVITFAKPDGDPAYIQPSPNYIATLGDSRTAVNLVTNAGVNLSAWNASGVVSWFRRLTGQRFRVVYHGGVSGDRTDQINERVSAALATRPGMVVYWGGINDIGGAYPTAGTSGATAFSNIKAAGVRCISSGALFVVFTEYPVTGWSASQVSQMHELNARLSYWAQTTPGVVLFDTYRLIVDGTNSTSPTQKSGYTWDGTHPSMRGAYVMGKALATALSGIVPALGPRRVGGLQDVFANNPYELLPNGNHLTTSGGGGSGTGGVTGTIPGSINITRSGSSAATAVSTSASPDGLSGNDCILTITGAASGDYIQYRPLPTLGNFILGETYQAIAEIDVSGTANVDSVRLSWAYEHASTTSYFALDSNYATGERSGVPDSETWSETLMTEPMTIPATGVTLTAVRMYLEIRFNGAAGAAVVKVRNASLRRIPA